MCKVFDALCYPPPIAIHVSCQRDYQKLVNAAHNWRLARRVQHIEYDMYRKILERQDFSNICTILEKFQALRTFHFHTSGGEWPYRMNVKSFFVNLEALGFRRMYSRHCDNEEIICWEVKHG
jgi:hypothetical protein